MYSINECTDIFSQLPATKVRALVNIVNCLCFCFVLLFLCLHPPLVSETYVDVTVHAVTG